MLTSLHSHRRFGLTRCALASASLLVLSATSFAQTAPPPAPSTPAQAAGPVAGVPADKSDKRADTDAADAKRMADRAAFFDARVAAVHAGLQLTPDQEKLWPPVNTAVHDFAGVLRADRDKRRDEQPPANAVEGLQRLSERTFARGTALKRLSDAITPLYASLDGDQKDRLPKLMRGMGPRMGSEFSMRDDGGPGMDRDRRGDGDRRQSFRGDDRRDWQRQGDAGGDRFRDEHAEGRSSGDGGDWGFEGRGPRGRDDRGGYHGNWHDED